jgi:DNA-directed RNA polymerase specialized sigma subunit
VNNKYTIVNKYSTFHVPQAINGYEMGFADYLSGCIGLLTAIKRYNISDLDVICDYREHPINMFICNRKRRDSLRDGFLCFGSFGSGEETFSTRFVCL